MSLLQILFFVTCKYDVISTDNSLLVLLPENKHGGPGGVRTMKLHEFKKKPHQTDL